ncbi:MAG TPA: MupA/Atu3671 family FMN-dependent luciferase-like monooxygenase [Methylibium sp.]|nr:MupA/Atu3671 family FMN-dependent luciferase-like monooxygenase [Methylibium sp.]
MQIDPTAHAERPLAFSLYYFASDEGGPRADAQRRLLFESARFADRHGFSAVWAPERHFHAFGGLSPNPSVLGAALATLTQRLRIRSGSVVVPLHHPVRVVEEWSLVDFLSGGRVDLGLASGWFPNDFLLAPPGAYEQRGELVFERAAELRQLWAGAPYEGSNPLGERVRVHTMPRPVQRELPIWITAAGNPQTFRRAGALGLNVLTHLLGQSLEALADKIAAYRAAWAEAGHPGRGTVSLMLHTFVGEDDATVRRTVKAPMLDYLASSANLVGGHTASVPFFQQRCPVAAGKLTPQDVADALEFSFERYYATSSLLGSFDRCLAMTDRLKAIEVDEVACLIDFGLEADTVLAALPLLDELREVANLTDVEPVS